MRNEELIVEHIGYACQLATRKRRLLGIHIEQSDLESEAIFGLVKAGARFDAIRGVPFGGFVHMRIMGSLEDFLEKNNQKPFCELTDIYTTEAARENVDLRRAVKQLPSRLRRFIVLRFWFGFDHRQLAGHFGVSVNRIWQLQREAFMRIRSALGEA